ncbi:hypothetical protein BUALT_Bualt04G0034800 [Buddleja alternifolia]|uniref:Uncharacterized protein n=1 Tax=Buddleja alternifolia TaxID=168488 RepID=A0AAV6XMY1_9LAMI|nr:hypothetical protein BUALT_Bualt04G0034800 [Buddleja alternifolia]
MCVCGSGSARTAATKCTSGSGSAEPLPYVHFLAALQRDWNRGVEWALSRWRGKHKVNVAYRGLVAEIVYLIWNERNIRWFEGKTRTPSEVAHQANSIVKNRLLTMKLDDSLQCIAVRRLWRISWQVTFCFLAIACGMLGTTLFAN